MDVGYLVNRAEKQIQTIDPNKEAVKLDQSLKRENHRKQIET